jgi:hypothetical protein
MHHTSSESFLKPDSGNGSRNSYDQEKLMNALGHGSLSLIDIPGLTLVNIEGSLADSEGFRGPNVSASESILRKTAPTGMLRLIQSRKFFTPCWGPAGQYHRDDHLVHHEGNCNADATPTFRLGQPRS